MAALDFNIEQTIDSVGEYKFEPIKGYPMLNWKGKRPFTSTQYYPAQLKETHGEEVDGWMNKIFWGDNLQVMSHLLKKYRGQIDLIYIDPPYDSKADYKKTIRLKGEKVENDRTAFEEKQYTDIWTNDEYLQFMYERFILLRELLSETGSIYVHCDWHKVHHLRMIMDEIFGPERFVNEIIWSYRTGAGGSNEYNKQHDNILFYSKTQRRKFNEQKEKSYTKAKGRKAGIVNYGAADTEFFEDENGVFRWSKMRDVWDISYINSQAIERQGYPTQKPEELIERILLASSDTGSLVLDCFMGSGTTQAVAMKLGRKFIGADINLGAIQTTTKRLLNIADELNSQIKKGVKYTGFSVYNVNHYDVFRNPLEAKELLIKALEIQPLPNNTLYDGEKDGRLVKIMPINRIATRADLNELINGFDYKKFEKLSEINPGKAVENLLLVCMGHEQTLAAELQKAVSFKLDIEVVDILRDKSNLEFKREAEADILIKDGKLIIRDFYPMNLLQKLSLQKDKVDNWKELTDSIMIDFNYDGSVFEPNVIDVPEKDSLVKGVYSVPIDVGNIKVKITDLLSESFETTISNG